MALSRTSLLSAASGTSYGFSAWTTGSFTPPDNCLLVVALSCVTNAESTNPSIASTCDSTGLTFTNRVNTGTSGAPWARGSIIFTAPVTTGASMTLTFDNTLNMYQWFCNVIAYTGYDTGTPTGATASKQPTVTDGAESITLSGAPASDSEVVAVLYASGATSVTHGTGWTELYDQHPEANVSHQLQVRTGSTSTTVGWDDVLGGGTMEVGVALALEIKAAAGGATTKPAYYYAQL